jgi:hypothetical protein
MACRFKNRTDGSNRGKSGDDDQIGRFLLTAPPFRFPGVVGSPATPTASD